MRKAVRDGDPRNVSSRHAPSIGQLLFLTGISDPQEEAAPQVLLEHEAGVQTVEGVTRLYRLIYCIRNTEICLLTLTQLVPQKQIGRLQRHCRRQSAPVADLPNERCCGTRTFTHPIECHSRRGSPLVTLRKSDGGFAGNLRSVVVLRSAKTRDRDAPASLQAVIKEQGTRVGVASGRLYLKCLCAKRYP